MGLIRPADPILGDDTIHVASWLPIGKSKLGLCFEVCRPALTTTISHQMVMCLMVLRVYCF